MCKGLEIIELVTYRDCGTVLVSMGCLKVHSPESGRFVSEEISLQTVCYYDYRTYVVYFMHLVIFEQLCCCLLNAIWKFQWWNMLLNLLWRILVSNYMHMLVHTLKKRERGLGLTVCVWKVFGLGTWFDPPIISNSPLDFFFMLCGFVWWEFLEWWVAV